MRRNSFFLSLSLYFLTLNSYSQGPETKLYVVITFEDIFKISQHGKRDYFWIIQNDSLVAVSEQVKRRIVQNIEYQIAK
jgi:hypothetical protein